jgi:hypothetical protein
MEVFRLLHSPRVIPLQEGKNNSCIPTTTMMPATLLGAVLLAGAAASAAAQQEQLVFRDVNIAAVTDVHSWIAGGDRQVPPGTPVLDATFGDLTSFIERARAAAAKEGALGARMVGGWVLGCSRRQLWPAGAPWSCG